jgi:hypothetical protein
LSAAGGTAGTGFVSSFASTASSGLSSIASTLAPLFTNPFTIAIGAGIAGFFALKSIFGGPSDFERAGDEIGFAVGEGVQHGIVNLFEERGGTIGEAITLSLGEVIKGAVAEGTADFDVLSEKVADTFSLIEQGGITSAEGMAALSLSVNELVPQLDTMGAVGRDQMERLLRASFSTGQSFEGVDRAIQGMADRLVNDAQAGGEAFLQTMNTLGVTGTESLEFIKNFAAQSGVELTNLEQITALLMGQLQGVGAAGSAAASGVQQIVGAANAAAQAVRAIPSIPGGDRGDRGPVTGARHGFEGQVTGPRTFVIEPGVTEDVSITKPGEGKRDVSVNMGAVTVNVGGGGSGSALREMVDALERNNEDQAERLKRILETSG